MMVLETILNSFNFLAYPIVVIGMFVEGTLSLLIFGSLSHSPSINLGLVFVFAVVGELIHDSIFWWIGTKIRKKHDEYKIKRLEKITKFLESSNSFMGIYIFISKFVWNLNRLTTMSAGYIGISFKKFMKTSFISTIMWVTTLLSIGYVFADQTQIMKQKLWVAGLYLAGIFAVAVVIQLTFSYLIKKYSLSNGNEGNKKQARLFSLFNNKKEL